MKKLIAGAILILLMGGCSSLATSTVSTVKPQQALDLLQATHKTVLNAEVIYILQPPCGKPASPPAPFCASLAVGKQMQQLDVMATKALADAQTAIDNAGSNPTAVTTAIAAANLAVIELQTFTNANTGAKP